MARDPPTYVLTQQRGGPQPPPGNRRWPTAIYQPPFFLQLRFLTRNSRLPCELPIPPCSSTAASLPPFPPRRKDNSRLSAKSPSPETYARQPPSLAAHRVRQTMP